MQYPKRYTVITSNPGNMHPSAHYVETENLRELVANYGWYVFFVFEGWVDIAPEWAYRY